MRARVVGSTDGHRCVGDGAVVESANRFLDLLVVRQCSPATVRAYAFDLANFAAFLAERSPDLHAAAPSDVFHYLAWKCRQRPVGGRVMTLRRRGPAPATMNRRVAAARGLFEHLVMIGKRDANPVPAARRAAGLRSTPWTARACRRRVTVGGQLVRQPQRLPESVAAEDLAAFLADLETHRDRSIVLATLLGGLRRTSPHQISGESCPNRWAPVTRVRRHAPAARMV